jgi:hypothetical protein
MQIDNQCNPQWAGHALGYVSPGTICQYGCLLCVLCDIAYDSFGDMHYTPDKLDGVFQAAGIFEKDSTGTFDLLPNDALDRVWPGRFKTETYSGFRADLVKAAIPTPDTYVYYWVHGYSPYWKVVVATHYVHGWSADGAYIGDVEGGVVRALSAYGGPANVGQTVLVKRLPQTPAPIPAPPAPTPPPPAPTYTVATSGGVVLTTGGSYDWAVTAAKSFAAAHVGTLYEVRDSKGNTVDTEFVAPLPAPVPTPIPPPTPTPLPTRQPNIWDTIDGLLVSLILALKRTPHK